MNRDLFSPTHLHHLAAQYGLRPSKQYGQHFLIDPSAIAAIIEAGEVKKTDCIVEIGPGFGTLTFGLADRAERVVCFEIEQTVRPYWSERQKDFSNIEIIWGNALRSVPVAIAELKERPYKVISNLPYQITGAVFEMLFAVPHPPERIVVMVQEEVALRMIALPKHAGGTGNMSLLTLAVQYYGTPRLIRRISKEQFWPAPKVDSAIIRITDIQRRPEAKNFFRVAKAGFAHRRKQLAKNLTDGLHLDSGFVKQVLLDMGKKETVRAEELSVHEWSLLAERLKIKN